MATQTASKPQRLVPTEATLQSLRTGLYYLLLLPVWIVTLCVPHVYQFGMTIGNHVSFIVIYALGPVLQYFIRGEQWKDLDARRLQAASSMEQHFHIQPAISYTPSIYTSICLPQNNSRHTKITLGGIFFLLAILLIGLMYYSWSSQWSDIIQSSSFSGWILVDMLSDMLPLAALLSILPFIFTTRNIRQIVITPSGLMGQYSSSVSYIPWHEARLFAIIGVKQEGKKPPTVTYELASETQSIRWSPEQVRYGYDQPYQVIGFSGKPREEDHEVREQLARLSEIVAAHTGLPLQDLRPNRGN